MTELSTKIITRAGKEKIITVELENELADWLITQPEDVQRDFILFEYKARCVERKETRRTQSFDSSLDNGFDIADESADNADTILMRLTVENALSYLTQEQQWLVEQIYYKGRSRVEVAKELGLVESAVRSRLATILKKIEKILK